MTANTETQTKHHKAEVREQRAADVAAQHETAAAKQAERGKRGARLRVLGLLDEDSFQELDPVVQGRGTTFGMERSRPYGDGIVTGFGAIDGRLVAVFSQDFTVYGGSLGEAFAEKLVKLMDLAARYGVPIVVTGFEPLDVLEGIRRTVLQLEAGALPVIRLAIP